MLKKFTIKINKISKKFDQKKVLDKASFSLYFGGKVGLVGANGSGKTTLLKIIAKKIKADEGQIEIFKNFKISYLPQEIIGNKSSGEKAQEYLRKISQEKSPIILLDEPTNNLDTTGLKFLENLIQNSKATFLIISHDREFLDQTVSKIIELDEYTHRTKIYSGNYSDYQQQKKDEQNRMKSLYRQNQRGKNKIQNEILQEQKNTSKKNKKSFSADHDKYINSYKSDKNQKKSSKRLKNAQKKLEKFSEKNKIYTKRPLKIDFSDFQKTGQKILELEKENLEIFSGDRVLVSGKNGSGKTTLLKKLLQENKWGTNIEIGYLPQDFLQEENSSEIFLEYFLKQTEKTETDARKILARFGFTIHEISQKISALSPGLRGRGQIALMLANSPNLLILDEPTNNLDLEVLEQFETALQKFPGTIIFVSHDRRFIEKINPNKFIKF